MVGRCRTPVEPRRLCRWAAFRDGGLRRYNARRNDALDSGVSRMSAYLHYGHVSPFRIAREAAAIGGAGADKYLDELLIWREMSWAWAFHARTHDDLSALPAWAQETLAAHAGDERPTLHDWERLARARTGDALWMRRKPRSSCTVNCTTTCA